MHHKRKPSSVHCWLFFRLLFSALIMWAASMGMLMSGVSAYSADVKPIRWLLARQGIAAIAADAEASRLLDNTQPFVRQNRNITAVPPPSWNAIPFDTFARF